MLGCTEEADNTWYSAVSKDVHCALLKDNDFTHTTSKLSYSLLGVIYWKKKTKTKKKNSTLWATCTARGVAQTANSRYLLPA